MNLRLKSFGVVFSKPSGHSERSFQQSCVIFWRSTKVNIMTLSYKVVKVIKKCISTTTTPTTGTITWPDGYRPRKKEHLPTIQCKILFLGYIAYLYIYMHGTIDVRFQDALFLPGRKREKSLLLFPFLPSTFFLWRNGYMQESYLWKFSAI